MKKIRLRTNLSNGGNEPISTVAVLQLVVGNSPNKPLSVDEIRRRVRILDALDAGGPEADFFLLEDDDHKVLAAAVEGFPWSAASRWLLTVIDDVLQAKPAALVSDALPRSSEREGGPAIVVRGSKERA